MNVQDKKKGYTSLMWAIAEGRSTVSSGSIVSRLARPNVPSSAQVIHVLVGAGADLNAQDRWGFTALMQAARRRYSSAVQVSSELKCYFGRLIRAQML